MVAEMGSNEGGAADGGTPGQGVLDAEERDWEPIRIAYESGEGTLVGIAAQFGITRSALSYRARRKGWAMRHRSRLADRPLIIARLFRLLEAQIVRLENQAQDKTENATMTASGEKEIAVLGKLAGTLEKLIEIDNATQAERRRPGPSRDMKALRDKLVQRIAQLKQD